VGNKSKLLGLAWKRLPHLLLRPVYAERQGRVVGRSIFIRQIDGGSCNAIELEIAALFNPIYDIEQYGFHLVASPLHADILLLSGPLTQGMEAALIAAFRAMSEPRYVITVGDGFLEQGLFQDSYAIVQPLPTEITMACVGHVPGNPPDPSAILEVLLTLPTIKSRHP
jgi:Ni,Fe-hydrogenase III small subunit